MRTFQLFSALLFPVAAAVAQAGTLDPTFGTGGKAVANVPGTYCSGQALAQQADGKILVCGQTPGLTLLVRFNADGTLDTGFGTNGLVTTDVDASNDYIGSIAVQPDNKIVVAGNKFDALANGTLIVMRYSADGDLDNSFSSDGIAELVFPTPTATQRAWPYNRMARSWCAVSAMRVRPGNRSLHASIPMGTGTVDSVQYSWTWARTAATT
ncbi:MAG: hypothetical protein IPL64_01060 [Flavobacteriales bacterium]|nr:hypothetical protein [Flavobacteriales bacterium]